LGFPHSYLDEVKNIYVDCTKLSVIARPVGGEQLGFQNKLKDEVVIVTDAKLEIVFASHNMTKMNGYVEVMEEAQKCFKVILLMY
jgi:ABC-type Na+ transport system ATPase subunit NatA